MKTGTPGMPLEKTIEKRLKTAVEKQLKGLCLKFVPFHFTGFPDRVCLLPGGIVFFVELKRLGKELSPRQSYVHKQLKNLGFAVYKIDSKEQIEELIKKY